MECLPISNEYVCIGESTCLESMKRWVKAICRCFEARYLMQTSYKDFDKQIQVNIVRDFSGMFGSIDCLH